MTAAPSVTNYSIPTGKVYFTEDGGSRTDLGNCVEFSVTNDITTKDHIRTYGGSRRVDKTIVTLASSTVRFTLDEITETAIAMWSLGTKTDNTGGAGFDIFALTDTAKNGVIEVIGDNSEGPQVDYIAYINLAPSDAFQLIRNNDDWNTVPMQGKTIAHATHGFGHFTQRSIGEGLTA